MEQKGAITNTTQGQKSLLLRLNDWLQRRWWRTQYHRAHRAAFKISAMGQDNGNPQAFLNAAKDNLYRAAREFYLMADYGRRATPRYATCPDCGEIPGPAHWNWDSPCPQRKLHDVTRSYRCRRARNACAATQRIFFRGNREAIVNSTKEVIALHRRQFNERFGEEVSTQTLLSVVNFTGIASDISDRKSQAESDAYMEMVARFILDIRESQP